MTVRLNAQIIDPIIGIVPAPVLQILACNDRHIDPAVMDSHRPARELPNNADCTAALHLVARYCRVATRNHLVRPLRSDTVGGGRGDRPP